MLIDMAKRIQVLLDDDIDGSTAAETVRFGLDGTDYEIDLSERNSAALRKALDKYVTHSRKLGKSGGSSRSASTRSSTPRGRAETQAIREWARSNGFEVSDRGRISEEVSAAYRAANN